MQLPQEKVIKIIHTEEALNIKVHITQRGELFFQLQMQLEKNCIQQSNQENTYYLIKRFVRVKDFSSANTDSKSYELNQINEAQNV